MANTYSQIYIHIVFSVKNRTNLIKRSWKDELYKYITGIVKSKKQKLIAINGEQDHIHVLIGMKPDMKISDLVRDIKANSTNFINDKRFSIGKFEWQEGYGAFSCSRSQLQDVIRYIENQEEHHRTRTFREEYVQFLRKYNIKFEEKYLPTLIE